jgi:nitrous oxidase accessory protein NosD
MSGICIAGNDADNVRVSQLTVRGFPGPGITSVHTIGLVADHNRLLRNSGYGIFAQHITRPVLHDNLAESNGDAGFYIGESPRAYAVLIRNQSIDNRDPGILVRSASFVTASHNIARENCVGLLVLGHAPGLATHFAITGNRFVGNRRVCSREPHDFIPPLAGVGIGLIGADDARVERNAVTGNGAAGRSGLSGGVLVRRSVSGHPARRDAITHNRVSDNRPADLSWDGAGDDQFEGNRCGLGKPSNLCR